MPFSRVMNQLTLALFVFHMHCNYPLTSSSEFALRDFKVYRIFHFLPSLGKAGDFFVTSYLLLSNFLTITNFPYILSLKMATGTYSYGIMNFSYPVLILLKFVI